MILLLAIFFLIVVSSDPIRNATNVILKYGNVEITGIIPFNQTAQFLGIPYASASRWEDSLIRPLESLIATSEPKGCPQICDSHLNCPKYISEDCLFLNIWTPFTVLENVPQLKPVLIYIHGGSFKTGHGYAAEFGDLAMALDCVIVSFNYRLSIFGFIEKSSIFENLGIKDQRVALLWIYENIGKFGGDQQKISILGQSAGALSALIHLAHPQTGFLVKNMILMSPPAVPFASKEDSNHTLRSLNSSLCQSNESAELFECLKNQSMMALLLAENEQKKESSEVLTKALPARVDNLDILEHPFDILKNATLMNGVNVLIGTNSNETYLFLDRLFSAGIPTPIFDIALLAMFGAEKSSIKEQYIDTEGFAGNQKSRLVQITSDAIFTCSLKNALKNSALAENIFTYIFEVPFLGMKDQPSGNVCDGLACHGTDLAYLLDTPFKDELKTITITFRTFVSNFIRFGNPSMENNTWLNDGLMKFSSSNVTFQTIHPLQETCKFWNEKQELFRNLDHQSSKSMYSSVAIFGLLFFVFFILIQMGMIIYSWSKLQKLVRIQKAIKVFDNQTLNLSSCSFDSSYKISETSFYSTLSHLEPLELACENLSVRFNKTIILNDITVSFSPGSFTAIMGPSGCGKTTLLTALRGRLKNYSNGDIFIGFRNILDVSLEEMNCLFGFVSQHNPPFSGLTGRELLNYYARLLFPQINDGEIAQKTLDILNLMELMDCCDVVISEQGSSTKGGLSGGQLRRIAIGLVLLQIPSIIILDEPTSGLDSENAFEVIQILSKLAKYGHTVICTIHQPRIEVYQLFSDILVLTKSGILYHGSPTDADGYLEKHFNETLEKALNPADSLLKLASNYSYRSSESWNSDDSIDEEDYCIADATEGTLVDDDEFLDSGKTLPTIYEISDSDSRFSSTSIIELYVDCDDNLSTIIKINPAVDSCVPKEVEASNLSLNDESNSTAGLSAKESLARSETSITQKSIGNLEKLSKEIVVLNDRWWNTRPFSRKVMMLIICIITSIVVGIIHRRPGKDIIAFELQMKGLLLGCIGLPAIKNIAISYDFYRNKELYEFDSINGLTSHLGFFTHRIIYETSMSSLEALSTLGFGALILDCNLNRLLPMLAIFVAYYNTVAAFFTCLFSSRLGGPEARSISFLMQALFAITSGLWIHNGDGIFFSAIEWLKFINPQYWAVSSLIYQNVHSSGECEILGTDGTCLVTAGDAFESHVRLMNITSSTSILSLIAIWTGIRIVQYLILRFNGLKN